MNQLELIGSGLLFLAVGICLLAVIFFWWDM